MIKLTDKDRDNRPPLTMGWAVPAAHPVPVPWEYRLLHTDGQVVTAAPDDALAPIGTSVARALEIMGAEQWELVALHERADGPIYVFKRPISGEKW